jgi:sporulation protein YlmC with PRC-barrel domain
MHHDSRRGRHTAKLRSPRVDRFVAMMALMLVASASFGALPAAAQTSAPTTPQQPAPKQPPAPAPAPTQGATPATVLDDQDIESILGKEIYSATNEDMGQIVDVLVDRKGQVRAAIIDFGGFLGVGTRKIAVDWRAIQFAPKSNRIVLALTRDEVRVAPEYKQGEPIVVLGPSATLPPPASAPGASANAAPGNAPPAPAK